MKDRSAAPKSHPYERATRRFYEATPYDTFLPTHDPGFNAHVGVQVIRSLPPDVRSTVVDVGCGTGWLLRNFSDPKSMHVVGIDLSRAALMSARAPADPQFSIGSNARIPIASSSVDAALSCGVVHHTADPRQSFDELVRILKPGGLLALQIYNREDIYFWIYQVFGGPLRVLARWFPFMTHVYKLTLLPLFFLAARLRAYSYSGNFKSKTYKQAWNHFSDFFLTPRAEFYRRKEVEAWLTNAKLRTTKWDRAFGEHCIIAQKM